MTTDSIETRLAAMHRAAQYRELTGLPVTVYNPKNRRVRDLPVIYGFNNGGVDGLLDGVLLAEDGTFLGGHASSAECYMPADLGVLDGCRPDRHEAFRAHYPDGYRMAFVNYAAAGTHPGLQEAYRRSQVRQS